MAQNFKKSGEVTTLTAPSGGVVAGQGYVISSIFVVAAADAAEGELFEGHRVGEWELPKEVGFEPAEGDKVWWDDTLKIVVATDSNFFAIGAATAFAASAATTARVVLDGIAVTAEA